MQQSNVTDRNGRILLYFQNWPPVLFQRITDYKEMAIVYDGLRFATTKFRPTLYKPYKRRRLHSTPQQEQISSIPLNCTVAEAM